MDLVQELEQLKTLHESHPSEDTLNQLEKVKTDLEFLEETKVEGIIVKAKARWHKHAEKSSKYFRNLEKRNHIRKHIPN